MRKKKTRSYEDLTVDSSGELVQMGLTRGMDFYALPKTGKNAWNPIEKAAGMDIVEVKKQYGDKLTLIGNIPIPILTHGTPKECYKYVLYLLENISKDGGHIISSSHSVTRWCKLDNFLAYQNAVENHGSYPINIK